MTPIQQPRLESKAWLWRRWAVLSPAISGSDRVDTARRGPATSATSPAWAGYRPEVGGSLAGCTRPCRSGPGRGARCRRGRRNLSSLVRRCALGSQTCVSCWSNRNQARAPTRLYPTPSMDANSCCRSSTTAPICESPGRFQGTSEPVCTSAGRSDLNQCQEPPITQDGRTMLTSQLLLSPLSKALRNHR